MKKIKIIREDHIPNFEEKVNEYLKKDWKLYNSIISHSGYLVAIIFK